MSTADSFGGRPRTAQVIAASNRAAAGVYEDRTGPVIADWLRDRGYTVGDPVVVPDGDPVAEALRRAVADDVDVVITTGGTGINPTDRTPEATRAVLDYEIPGLADAIRAAGLPAVPTAVLSRGVAGRTLVINLPGSTGGVRDGLGVLADVLTHAIDQLHGGDHTRPDATGTSHARPGPTDTDHAETGHVRPDRTGADHGGAGDHTDRADHDHTGDPARDRSDHDHTDHQRTEHHTMSHKKPHHRAVRVDAPAVTAHLSAVASDTEPSPVFPAGSAGPAATVLRAVVTEVPLSESDHADLVANAKAGAVVTFAGVVRDHDGGRGVRELEYVGHPSAGEVVAEVAADLAKRTWDGHPVRAIAVSHRIGLLAIGDAALVVAVAADHRREAFAACADLVDEIKSRLPVWKRQVFADGTEEWVNCA